MRRAVFLPMILLMLSTALGTASGDSSNLEGGVLIAHHPAGLQTV